KATVCSWICVRAWSRPIARPTTMPTMSAGAAIIVAMMRASRARSTAVCGFIGHAFEYRSDSQLRHHMEALKEHFDAQVPTVNEHGEEQFERQRNQHRRQHQHAHGDRNAGNDNVE